MAKRLVLFNHKGGVNKTTTAYNVGWVLASTDIRFCWWTPTRNATSPA
jgi:cellulose biosynthesis protein BcsQ